VARDSSSVISRLGVHELRYLAKKVWIQRHRGHYRLGAPNAPGRSTPHATTSVYQKNEAIEPQQMMIILQYLCVVLITILRRVSAIQNIFWASGLIASWSFAMGQL
jgi:hypothetical protein